MRIKSLITLIISFVFIASCSKQSVQDERLNWVSSLFSGADQSQKFDRVYEYFPTSQLFSSSMPLIFDSGLPINLPNDFKFQSQSINVGDYLKRTDVTALLILKDGKIRYENYWLTGGEKVKWLSMSVGKSFISALIGIALDQNYIKSIEDPITMYVSQLKNSAYDGVRIKDILQMSSGASWNEDYGDPNSDINRSVRIFALGGSLDEFAASLTNENKPGTFNRYNSTDTQVLGMLLREATGISVTQFMQEMLWEPMGAEENAFWLLDSKNMEVAYGGLNATARDYAKLGELYRLKGKLNGKQIVPSEWINASIKPDAPHLMPGENSLSDYPLGYGYQWWIPDSSGDYMAIGVYNQFIYISPENNTVIVHLAANKKYGVNDQETILSEFESIEFLRTIANENF
jgi:CubicO group peptidase (beta-lactamase class C family)